MIIGSKFVFSTEDVMLAREQCKSIYDRFDLSALKGSLSMREKLQREGREDETYYFALEAYVAIETLKECISEREYENYKNEEMA